MTLILAAVIFVGLYVFWAAYRNMARVDSTTPEDIVTLLGPGYDEAFDKAAEKCGTDIKLLAYRIGGSYQGDAYRRDTFLSKGKLVEYAFTQGSCAPGYYAAIEVVYDVVRGSVTDGPKEHALAGDSREPMDEADFRKITISADEAAKIGGLQPTGLIKYDGSVIWTMGKLTNGLTHQIWIDAVTGKKIKDEKVRLKL